jgi:hypothetical protein
LIVRSRAHRGGARRFGAVTRCVEVWRSRAEQAVIRDVIRGPVPTTDVVVTIQLAEVFTGLA